MAMCENCCKAADTRNQELHCSDPSCTCQHKPAGDSRVPIVVPVEADTTYQLTLRTANTPQPNIPERQTF